MVGSYLIKINTLRENEIKQNSKANTDEAGEKLQRNHIIQYYFKASHFESYS